MQAQSIASLPLDQRNFTRVVGTAAIRARCTKTSTQLQLARCPRLYASQSGTRRRLDVRAEAAEVESPKPSNGDSTTTAKPLKPAAAAAAAPAAPAEAPTAKPASAETPAKPPAAVTAVSAEPADTVTAVASPPAAAQAQASPAAAAAAAPPAKPTAAPATDEVAAAIAALRAAAHDASMPPKRVFESMRLLDRAKLAQDIDWDSTVAGTGPGVRRWRLAFTAKGTDMAAAARKQPTKGGNYWSIPAAAIGFAPEGKTENGVYLGFLASLRFEGNYEVKGNKMGFEYSKVTVALGPLKLGPFTIKKTPTTTWDNPAKADGLFVLVYGDDEVMVARGKTGGIALWERASPSWQLENGVA